MFETATKPLRFFLSLLAGTFKSSPTPSFFQTLLTSKRTSLHNGLHFFDINFKSVPRRMCFANLTSKLVSRHNGVDLFDIWTSKSAPRPSVWQHSASKFASRHRGLQFFISHLPRWLRTRRFNELSFSTLRSHKSLEKCADSRLAYLFADVHLLPSDAFCSLIFLCLLFSFLTRPTFALSLVYLVGSLTSQFTTPIDSDIFQPVYFSI